MVQKMTIKNPYVNIENPKKEQKKQFIFCGWNDNELSPQLDTIFSYRSLKDEDRGSNFFWRNFKCCESAMIIDKFLDIYVLERMCKEINEREKSIDKFFIKILYSRNKDKKKKELMIKIENIAKQKKGNVEFKHIPDTKWIIHDRFVLMDDILWHFGADIGGGHKDFNAYSTGWENTEFEQLFDSLWKEFSK